MSSTSPTSIRLIAHNASALRTLREHASTQRWSHEFPIERAVKWWLSRECTAVDAVDDVVLGVCHITIEGEAAKRVDATLRQSIPVYEPADIVAMWDAAAHATNVEAKLAALRLLGIVSPESPIAEVAERIHAALLDSEPRVRLAALNTVKLTMWPGHFVAALTAMSIGDPDVAVRTCAEQVFDRWLLSEERPEHRVVLRDECDSDELAALLRSDGWTEDGNRWVNDARTASLALVPVERYQTRSLIVRHAQIETFLPSLSRKLPLLSVAELVGILRDLARPDAEHEAAMFRLGMIVFGDTLDEWSTWGDPVRQATQSGIRAPDLLPLARMIEAGAPQETLERHYVAQARASASRAVRREHGIEVMRLLPAEKNFDLKPFLSAYDATVVDEVEAYDEEAQSELVWALADDSLVVAVFEPFLATDYLVVAGHDLAELAAELTSAVTCWTLEDVVQKATNRAEDVDARAYWIHALGIVAGETERADVIAHVEEALEAREPILRRAAIRAAKMLGWPTLLVALEARRTRERAPQVNHELALP